MGSSGFGLKFPLTIFLSDLKCRCLIPNEKELTLHPTPHPSGGNHWKKVARQPEGSMNLDEPF
jgi:hypothetical protein